MQMILSASGGWRWRKAPWDFGITERTPYMIECSTGDIVLLPFPFTDFSTFKQRPALVISSPKWNAKRPDIIIAAISSRMHGSEFEYILNEKEERTGGLRVPSAVRLRNIYTIDKRLV